MKQLKQTLMHLHRWLGIQLGFLCFVVVFTGTLATLGYDLDGWLDDAYLSDASAMNWAAAEKTLTTELADHDVDFVRRPAEPGRAANAFVRSPSTQMQMALLHPSTGALQGVRSMVGPQFILRQVHKSLLVPKGLYIVSSFSLLLLFATFSGWWVQQRRRRQLLLLRWKEPKKRWTDLHRTLGLWSVVFALVIGVTGLWYFVEAVSRDAADVHLGSVHPPHLSDARVEELDNLAAQGMAPSRLALTDVVAIAEKTIPGLAVDIVIFPKGPDDVFEAFGYTGELLVRSRANRVALDPYSGAVLFTQKASDIGALTRWAETADHLHFGTFGTVGGLWTRLLYVLFGLVLSFAVLAGPVLAAKRSLQSGKPRPKLAHRLRSLPMAFSVLLVVWMVALTAMGASNPAVTGFALADAESDVVDVGRHRVQVVRHPYGEGRSVYRLRYLTTAPFHAKVMATLAPGETRTMHGWKQPTSKGSAADTITVSIESGGEKHEAKVTFTPLTSSASASTTPIERRPIALSVWVLIIILYVFLLAMAGAWTWFWWRPAAAGRS